MNKYLMITAAGLLAATANAHEAPGSGQQQFRFGTDGGSYCDGGTGFWNGDLYTWKHTNADCAGAVYQGGAGFLSKSGTIGRNVNLSDIAAYVLAKFSCSIAFPPKFRIGGTFTLLCVDDSGGISVGQGVLLPPNKGAPRSTKSLLRALLEGRSSLLKQ